MKRRCQDPNHDAYHHYGGRGITVCAEWEDFEVFFSWSLANGYSPELSLDRINNQQGYHPDNCEWRTWDQQANNTRKNILLTAFTATKTLAEWVKDPRCTVTYSSLYRRIRMGWDPETAITTPKLNSRYEKPGR